MSDIIDSVLLSAEISVVSILLDSCVLASKELSLPYQAGWNLEPEEPDPRGWVGVDASC